MKSENMKFFEKMVFQYEKAIFSHILGLVRQKETAEDLTQEVFIKFYKNLNKIDPDKSFKSWLYRIATNTVYDYWRRRREKRELLIIDGEENSFETIEEEDAYLLIANKNDLARALEKIKPIHKTIILMHYYQEFSYEEIATALEIPINTVKTHLHRAKKELKEKYDEH
ncbi:MAG: RNA polymerase sigma factor [Parcubacteria group bacterium]